MSSTPQPPFSYLRSKIREWKSGDLLPTGEQSWERFRQVAPFQLAPLVAALQHSLEEEGIRATVREISEQTRHLSLTIEQLDIAITFGPDEHPHLFYISACRRAKPKDECTALIAYQDLELDLGHVIEIIEDVALRIMGPRRASEEPTSK